jgi:energy-coupling factor transport system permease protein
MTWALETSVETADSMRARGYGATKRSNYNNYRISGRDFVAIIWIMSLFLMICFALFLGKANTYYYPYIRIKNSIPVYLMYGLLCLTPVVINVKEAAVWHRLK